MKKPSFRLLKVKNKMYQKAWNKAQKYYTVKYQKDLSRITNIFDAEVKTRVKLQHLKDLRDLDFKIEEVNDLKKYISQMQIKHYQYQKLKAELESVKSGLVVSFDSLFLTFGKLKSYFDCIDYVDYKHKKIKA